MNATPRPARPRTSWIAWNLLLLALVASPVLAQDPGSFEYVCPVPGSKLVSARNNIILRPGPPIVLAALNSMQISVVGAESGDHPGALFVSDDGRTAIFEPDEPFAPGEDVTVTVGRFPVVPENSDPTAGSTAGEGEQHGLRNLRFEFSVSPRDPAAPATFASEAAELDGLLPEGAGADPPGSPAPEDPGFEVQLNTLPSGFPTPSLLAANGPGPGYTFVAPFTPATFDPGHLLIMDGRAKPVFYRRLLRPATDFKPLPDGRLAFFTRETSSNKVPQFYVLDPSGAAVDSFRTGNGYVTDSHEMRLLPDGHVLLMAYDPQPVPMDGVVRGGRPDASVIGLVVQELDARRHVVFQWRSWDEMEITDAAPPIPLTGATVDYIHGNAIEVDLGGDLLISSRHLNEITKVSRRTGRIVWRMGPNARRNEFSFPNDPRGFSHQHDVRLLPNGNVTLFDNGNFLVPAYSRVLEYHLDEAGRVATLVWQYGHNPLVYGSFMGSYQRLPDGGGLVGWGGATVGPKVTEFGADGSTTFEIGFPGAYYWTYRAYRGPWRTTRLLADRTELAFDAPTGSGAGELPVVITNPGPGPVTLNYFVTAGAAAFSVPLAAPVTLAAGESFAIPVRFEPVSPGAYSGTAYLGAVTPTEVVVQDVALSGTWASRLGGAMMASAGASRPEAPQSPAGPSLGPIRDGASIAFSLGRSGPVRIEIFDVRGRRVAVPLDGERAAGEHTVEWRPAGRPSGVYFCRLTASDQTLVRRFARFR